ncbi:hypothetical protein CXG81DRAFT_17890 [Caulochytrium protostelioides]|uniref:Glycine cleavage system H protein n=1 Tax=Caulochytrium protostelioides TaxID=1555241 RepID=A0A4P9XAS7_9FUNG|nr:hypothetical protein CXG81DRAFT_17890 [Caulochytrium protostelioides]|eukprot:RKP02446.1 hypothetical protein CXG81DRAFT_17890 [Caulochytrium protostelioides]
MVLTAVRRLPLGPAWPWLAQTTRVVLPRAPAAPLGRWASGAASRVRPELLYTNDHEWIRFESAPATDKETTATVGITEFAVKALGDIVFVEVPEPATQVNEHDQVAAVESVKAVSDVYTPVSGEIVAVNEALQQEPSTLNADPFGEGWIFKLKGAFDTSKLLTPEQYKALIAEEHD